MNLSLAGCGFLGIYHVGVAVCFKKYAPHLLLNRISGASAGALAACCLLCDMPLGEMTSDFFRVVNEARSHSLGPFSPSFNIQTCLLEGLQKFLPEDAHLRVNGRLHISLTRVYDGKNVIVSQFNSREDLLQALLAGCFIPGFSGILPPRFHGVRYMDGAFSDNLPLLDENTVTVSPFCGESDICPRDQSSQLFHVYLANTSIELSKQNMNRFVRILFPPKPEDLSNICQQGFDDALTFLHRNNLISCTRCLAVQSTFTISETIQEVKDFDPECKECTQHRKDAIGSNLPESVLAVCQSYIESANKGLANWIFRHRGVKILQTLSLPATVPADFVCATLTNLFGDCVEKTEFRVKVVANIIMPDSTLHMLKGYNFDSKLRLISAAPIIGGQIWQISKYILKNINEILKHCRNDYKASTCKLSMTECGQQVNSTKTKTATTKSSPSITATSKSTILPTATVIPIPASQQQQQQQQQPNIAPPILSINSKHHIHRQSISEDNNFHSNSHDVDTFEHILKVTTHQDAVYTYYYVNEDNKVKVTEIFDMSDCDNPALQSKTERELNQQLQYDTEWDQQQPGTLTTPTCHDGCIKLNWESSTSRSISCSEDSSITSTTTTTTNTSA